MESEAEVTATPDVAQEAPAAEVTTTPAAVAEADPFDNEATQTFDRAYVEKLRKEAAERRTYAKGFDEAFESWTPEDRTVLLNVIKTAAVDPKAGAEAFKEIAKFLSPEEKAAVEDAIAEGEEAEEKPLTRSEWEKLDKEKEDKRALDKQMAQIESDAKELGYTTGTENEDYWQLLWVAQNKTNGNIKEAHEMLEAKFLERQAKYVADKAAKNDRFPEVAANGGATPATGRRPKTFQEARAAIEERINAAPGK